MHCLLEDDCSCIPKEMSGRRSFGKWGRRVWRVACCGLIVLVLQEVKGKGQRSSVALSCRGVLSRHLGQPPSLFETCSNLPSLPHPSTPTPSGLNNFLLAKQAASGSIVAADSGMCRHFVCELQYFWPCIMHCNIPEMSLQNCLLIEWRFDLVNTGH